MTTLVDRDLERFNKALRALEDTGWPCRLEELPDKYKAAQERVAELEKALMIIYNTESNSVDICWNVAAEVLGLPKIVPYTWCPGVMDDSYSG